MLMTLKQLTKRMREYNGKVSPGSTCEAWKDYSEDCYQEMQCGPGGDAKQEGLGKLVPDFFSEYWFEVATGTSEDYVPDTGEVN